MSEEDISNKLTQANELIKSAKDELMLLKQKQENNAALELRFKTIEFLSSLLNELSREHCVVHKLFQTSELHHRYISDVSYYCKDKLDLSSEKYGEITITGKNLLKY